MKTKKKELLAEAIGLYIHRLSIENAFWNLIDSDSGGWDKNHVRLHWLIGQALGLDFEDYYDNNIYKENKDSSSEVTFFPDAMVEVFYELSKSDPKTVAQMNTFDVGMKAIEKIKKLYKKDKKARPAK